MAEHVQDVLDILRTGSAPLIKTERLCDLKSVGFKLGAAADEGSWGSNSIPFKIESKLSRTLLSTSVDKVGLAVVERATEAAMVGPEYFSVMLRSSSILVKTFWRREALRGSTMWSWTDGFSPSAMAAITNGWHSPNGTKLLLRGSSPLDSLAKVRPDRFSNWTVSGVHAVTNLVQVDFHLDNLHDTWQI